jgi:predicted transcriptional regulator of viral defense system
MKWTQLIRKIKTIGIFRLQDLEPFGLMKPFAAVQLSHWVSQGKLIRLKRGFYAASPDEQSSELSPLWISGILYEPSYISLEYALSRFGLIPEAVSEITCVSTKKTQTFTTPLGVFSYRKVIPHYFFGYQTDRSPNGKPYWMATPEKALLDFFYLSIPKTTILTPDLLLEGYRLQNLNLLKKKKLIAYQKLFPHPRVLLGTKILLQLLEKSR